MSGWIKLHRKFLDWEWYSDINTKIVFLDFLLKANIKDTKYMGRIIPKGSLVVKIKELSRCLGLTENEIRTAINHLKLSKAITTKSTNRFTVVTVVNYNVYQDFETDKTQTKHEQNTNKTQPINNPLTSLEEEEKNKRIEEDKKRDIVNVAVDGLSPTHKTDYGKYLEFYKNAVKSLAMPKVLSDKRKKALKTLSLKLSDDDIKRVFELAEESDFLSGRNGKWTGCSFDWLINYNNALKVLEGQYYNCKKPENSTKKNAFCNYTQRDWDFEKLDNTKNNSTENAYSSETIEMFNNILKKAD